MDSGLTIFANLKINDPLRLERMKDSFFSFASISDDWLVNIRGAMREEAIAFLKDQLSKRGKFFELLDDARGWTVNASEMVQYAKHQYLLLWIEDHMNIAPQDEYRGIIRDLASADADYLQYSWWHFGAVRELFAGVPFESHGSIDIIDLTVEKWKSIIAAGRSTNIIAMSGIFKKDFFMRLFAVDRKQLSFFDTGWFTAVKKTLGLFGIQKGREKYFRFVNRVFFKNRIRRFSRETPFGLEFGPERTDILPVRIGLSKHELFACIDDDGGTWSGEEPVKGYQLVKRGLYPADSRLRSVVVRPDQSAALEGLFKGTDIWRARAITLQKGAAHADHYYLDEKRTGALITEKAIVLRGKIAVTHRGQTVKAEGGDTVLLYPNVGYTLLAENTSTLVIIVPDLSGRAIVRPAAEA